MTLFLYLDGVTINRQARPVQGQSLTVTVGYSDTLRETKTITNRFQAVRVTNILLQSGGANQGPKMGSVTYFREQPPEQEGRKEKV